MKRRVGILAFLFVLVGFAWIGVYSDMFAITGHALIDNGDYSEISRSFSGNLVDEDIVVTIAVFIDPNFDHNVYVIEELVPSGVDVVDNGSANPVGNVLRWSDINESGVGSVELTYTVESSEIGEYPFVGEYVIDGMDEELGIGGSSNLNVIELDEEAPVPVYNVDRPTQYSSSALTFVDFNWTDNVDVVDSNSLVEANFTGSFVNYSGEDWSGILDAGSYSVRGWAVDSSGNWGVSSLYSFEIPKADSDLRLRLSGYENDIYVGIGHDVPVAASANTEFILYLDGSIVSASPPLTFNFGDEGLYNFTAVVLGDANYNSYAVTRFVNVSIDAVPIGIEWDSSRWHDSTTNFSDVNLENFSGRFVNGFGEINFLKNLSINRNLNFSGVDIFNNNINIDSLFLPELNISAELKFYGLAFTDPRVLRDGVVCSNCVEISYEEGVLTVEVDSFSEYTTEESYVSPGDADNGGSSSGGSSSGGSSSGGGDLTLVTPTGGSDSVACVEDYICGSWSGCENGLKTRECIDYAECGVDRAEDASCVEEEQPRVLEMSLDILWWTLIILATFIVGILGWISFKIGGLGFRGLGR